MGYGREEEYGELDLMEVIMKGCVADMRSGRGYCEEEVERAARKGAMAVFVIT